jgi:hypothetical protein
MSISPNPTRDRVRVTFDPGDHPAAIQVFDVLGRTVQESAIAAGVNHRLLDVRALPTGSYLVTLTDVAGRRLAGRFTILR